MPKKRSIFTYLSRILLEEKVVLIASLITIVMCFLPWYSTEFRPGRIQMYNGFQSIGSFTAYIVFFGASLSIAKIISGYFSFNLPRFIRSHFFHAMIHGQLTFILALLFTTFARYALLDGIRSGIRFGIYGALIASMIAAVAGYVLWKGYAMDMKRKGLHEEFVRVPRKHQFDYLEDEMTPEENKRVVRRYDQASLLEDRSVSKIQASLDEDPILDGDATMEDLDRHRGHKGVETQNSLHTYEDEKQKLNF